MWEQGVYGKSPYLPLNFAVNQKLLQKTNKQNFFLKKKNLEEHQARNTQYGKTLEEEWQVGGGQ